MSTRSRHRADAERTRDRDAALGTLRLLVGLKAGYESGRLLLGADAREVALDSKARAQVAQVAHLPRCRSFRNVDPRHAGLPASSLVGVAESIPQKAGSPKDVISRGNIPLLTGLMERSRRGKVFLDV